MEKRTDEANKLDGLIRAFALLTAGLPRRRAEHLESFARLRLAREVSRREFLERQRARRNK